MDREPRGVPSPPSVPAIHRRGGCWSPTRPHRDQDRRMRAVLGALVLAVLVCSATPSSAGPDPAEGVWPLDPRSGGRTRLRAAARSVRRRSSRRRPGRSARSGGAGRAAGDGRLRRLHRRQARRHGAARRTSYDLRAGRGLGRAAAGRWPPGDVLGRLTLTDSHCFPAACLHWGLLARRGVPRPAHPRRLGTGAAAAPVARRARQAAVEPRLDLALPPLDGWRRPLRRAAVSAPWVRRAAQRRAGWACW